MFTFKQHKKRKQTKKNQLKFVCKKRIKLSISETKEKRMPKMSTESCLYIYTKIEALYLPGAAESEYHVLGIIIWSEV
uniref:RE10683p n=1 Tax=Drosophila melanogaster TaxID=7227 RepID=E1NZD3_DROME|nr:RE10683p [Drosophila melanogaster]